MSKALVSTSKLLSLVLRHKPDEIGLALDPQGWADVADLLHRMNAAGHLIDRAALNEVVATSDKQRFAFSPDGERIRANQGHSVAVDLDLPEAQPPSVLYHGTAASNRSAIQAAGLVPGRRHAVHLSTQPSVARAVGSRHGAPLVFQVDAARMHADGHRFHVSANGVWLASTVPACYLEVLGDAGRLDR